MKKGLLVLLGSLTLFAGACAVYHFSRPIGVPLVLKDQESNAHVMAFKHETPAAKSIIIFPPTGGINILDKLYAEDLFRAGFDVYILTQWTDSDEFALDLQIHQRFYTRVQKAIGLIIANIKSPWIGILGTSVGGLHTSIAMSTHDRLNSGMVITSGITIPEVVVNSNQEAMKHAKRERYKMFHFKDDEDYLKHLSAAFHLDPTNLPRKFEGKKLGIVIASKDDTVPTANQEKLKKFWNAQEVARFEHDHFYAIVRMGLFNRGKVVEFFSSP